MADDQVLEFLYDADLRHVESSVRCHRQYKNGRIEVDLGQIIFIYLHALLLHRALVSNPISEHILFYVKSTYHDSLDTVGCDAL